MKIKDIKIREIFATNTKKTIEIEIFTDIGNFRSSVPIGTSKSRYEVEYLDTKIAINNFKRILRFFKNKEFFDQRDVDEYIKIIDKTKNLKNIGGNVALALSFCFLKCFAFEKQKEVFEFLGKEKIPLPICNVAGSWGGDIQEFLVFPKSQKSFKDSIEKIGEVYLELGKEIAKIDPKFNFGKNLESGWQTFHNFKEILSIIKTLAESYNLRIGIDMAASSIWDGKFYNYSKFKISSSEQLNLVSNLIKEFKIDYIEDPFDQDSFYLFATLQNEFPNKMICGDDLIATNIERLEIGIKTGACRAVIVKPNQVGLISDLIDFVNLAKKNKLILVFSHRSAETEETILCHLAVGLGANYIKIGISGERIDKINEMIRIEEKF